MAEPMSEEVREMQRNERRRWLSVAEAQSLAKSWENSRISLDETVTRYLDDEESENAAQVFIALYALSLDNALRRARQAILRLQELNEPEGS